MKLSTRQYARKQVKWIRNRLIPAINAANQLGPKAGGYPSNIFLLDATGGSRNIHHINRSGSHCNLFAELGEKWDTNVKEKAITIMRGMAVKHVTRAWCP